MRAGIAQGGLVSPVLFSLYVNNMPTPYRHVQLALYTDDTALIATSRSPLLLVSYLETYLKSSGCGIGGLLSRVKKHRGTLC
jgi:hypothetical protein